MLLQIVNQTASARTYLSGTVSVPGSGTTSVTNTGTLKALAIDPQLRYDCINNNAQLSDSVNVFATTDAWAFLDLIARSIGGSVDSFANDHTTRQLFEDTYSTVLDTTNRWSAPVSAGGGVIVSNVLGEVDIGTGTTANGYSYLASQTSFHSVAPGWLQMMNAVNVEFPITVNAYRFWGFGSKAATPTAANPLTDAVGFEIATNGKMYAIAYSGSTRNVIQDLSAATGNGKQPADANVHKYFIFFRGDLTYYSIDTQDNVVAPFLTGELGPLNNTLPALMLSIAGSSAPSSNANIVTNAIFVGDTNGNNMQISDGMFGWRKATVNADGSMNQQGNVASGSADSGNPVKVGAVYNSTEPTPSSGQRVDLQANFYGALSIQFRNKFRNLTGNATTTVKSGAGVLHSVLINNNTTGGTVTIYDNTAGSGTIICALNVGTPSGGLLSTSGQSGPFSTGSLGLEFSTGLTVVTAGSNNNNVTLVYR